MEQKEYKGKKRPISKLYKPPDEQIFVTYQSGGQDEFFSAHTLSFPEKREKISQFPKDESITHI